MTPLLLWLDERDALDAVARETGLLNPADPATGHLARQLEIAFADLEARRPPWVPFRGPQTEAARSQADELLFGGQAGGGKGSLQVGLAVTLHRRSLILRRHSTELADLKEQLLRFAGPLGTWKSIGPHGGVFTFKDGRVVEMGGCEGEEWTKFSGRPHDLICYDEGGDMEEAVVNSLKLWNRHEDPSQRCRAVIGSNPPRAAEGRWMLDHYGPWVNQKHPLYPTPFGQLRWYAILDSRLMWLEGSEPFEHDNETIYPRSRTFLPARIVDNPIYATNKKYLANLQAAPEPLRSQLLKGDFTAGMEDDAWQCIPTAWVEAAMARWTETPPEGQALCCLGVDVARGGADATTVCARYGPWFSRVRKYKGAVTDDGDKAAALAMREYRWSQGMRPEILDHEATVNVDVIGVGASCYDALKRDHVGSRARAVNVSIAPRVPRFDRSRKYKLATYRSVMWWELREALDPNTGDDLMLPPDPELLADLTAPRYEARSGGIYIEPKDKIKERIGRSPDCFVAGTPVLTILGELPIEKVPLGMPVWTRGGWRRVIGAGLTDPWAETFLVRFSDGRELRGSGNHPVFVREKGWVRLEALGFADIIEVCNHERLSNSTASFSSGSPRVKVCRHGDTFTPSKTAGASRESAPFIRPSGSPPTGQFPQAMRFTTRTEIPSITTSPTLNALLMPNTTSGTATRVLRSDGTLSEYVFLLPPVRGEEARKGLPGIPRTARNPGQTGGPRSAPVLSAERITRTGDCTTPTGFARAPAPSAGITATRLSSSSRIAPAAAPGFSCRPLGKTSVVPVRVASVTPAANAPIFNLTVEGDHEFYANGILVHNCGEAVCLAHLELQRLRHFSVGL